MTSGCPLVHISINSRPSPDHRPFYLVYNHLAHCFAFALVLLYRIGNIVLTHLLLLSAHGLRLRGASLPYQSPLTSLLAALATNTVAIELFLDEINVIYTISVRRLVHYHH